MIKAKSYQSNYFIQNLK